MAEPGAGDVDVEGGGVGRAEPARRPRARGGIGLVTVQEATITAPICSGAMPAAAIALPPAATDRSWIVSSGGAKRRVAMPERERIHSWVESMC